MKDQRLGLIKYEEEVYLDPCWLKQQQISCPQYEQNSQKASPSQNLSIYKLVFQQLVSKTDYFISQILNKKATQTKVSYLLIYLAEVQKKYFSIQAALYYDTIDELKILFFNQVVEVWNNLSESQKYGYELTGANNYKIAQKLNSEVIISLNQFTGFQMFKIDIMCIVLLFSNNCSLFYKKKKTLLLSPFIQRIFDMEKAQLSNLMKKFHQFKNYLRFDYLDQFYKYTELLYLIELAYKLVNCYRRYGKDTVQNIPKAQIYSCKVEDTSEVNPKFKFCQVIYFTTFKNIRKQAKLLKKIMVKQALLEQKSQIMNCPTIIIKIAEYQQVPLQLVYQALQQINLENSSIQIQHSNNLEQKLRQCQWLFLNNSYSLFQGINIALGENVVTQQTIYWSKARLQILSILCKLAMERFKMLSQVYSAQVKLESKDLVYICRFQYSLREIYDQYSKLNISFQEQMVDQRCSLILGVVHNQVMFFSIKRNVMSDDAYVGLIKLCIRNFLLQYMKQFNLVLLDFHYEKTMDNEVFNMFINFMKKTYGSNVYIINDPSLFWTHLIINAFLRSFLVSHPKICRDNFYHIVQVCICKILTGIQKLDEKENFKSHFDYLQKVMSLEIKIAQLWRSFQKLKTNKYEAIISSTEEFMEQKKPAFILLNSNKGQAQNLLITIQYCQPKFHKFIEFYNKYNWRIQQSPDEIYNLANNIEVFLELKKMKDKDVRRILKDVTKFLLLYQVYFKKIIKENIFQGTKTNEINFLNEFYESQNKNIDAILCNGEREAIVSKYIEKIQNKGKKI